MFFSEPFFNILAFFLGFFIVVITIPPILRVAKAKRLFDPPNHRKIHTHEIPPLGGLSIFFGLILSTIIVSDDYSFVSLKYIIAAVILMFFIGLKDDLVGISALKKVVIQLLAIIMLIVLGNVHISNLHGLFGFYEISYMAGALITLFIIMSIINAFNFIDGIDGLASGLGIMASLVFGVWFFQAGFMQYAIMSFALTGSLSGFFLYNVFGKKNKLFMGDAGSLLVGLIIAILAIKFNEFNVIKTIPNAFDTAPVISFAIVMVPLIDVLRLILIRLFNGKSPLVADTNHLHHKLLVIFPNHLLVTLILIAANILIIFISLLLNHLFFNITVQFLLLFFISLILSFIPSFLSGRNHHKGISLFKKAKK